MHPEVHQWVKHKALAIPDKAKVLEVGSLNVNGTIRDYFKTASEYVGLDKQEGKGVDVVTDLFDWQVKENYFDVVVSTEMLEHCVDCKRAIEIMKKALLPEGFLIVTCAGIGRQPHGEHGEPDPTEGEYYENVDAAELVEYMRCGWWDLTVNILGSDLRLTARKPNSEQQDWLDALFLTVE